MPANQIDLHFTYAITDPDRFQVYLDAVIALTQDKEPYVLEYSLARSADGTVLQHERYEDEDAIRKHLEVTADAQRAWAESTTLLSIRFVGPLSAEFRAENDNEVASWWSTFRSIDR